MTITFEKDIGELQVAMDNPILVEIMDGEDLRETCNIRMMDKGKFRNLPILTHKT